MLGLPEAKPDDLRLLILPCFSLGQEGKKTEK